MGTVYSIHVLLILLLGEIIMNPIVTSTIHGHTVGHASSILTETFTNAVADIVVGYEAEKLSGEDNYKRMVNIALDTGAYDKASYFDALLPGELEILEYRKAQGENVQTKTGKWKMSKVCSNSTYSSTKAVVGGALEAGVDLLDADGNIKGKSQLEKETKEAKPEKSADEKLATAYATFINIYGNCTENTQREYASLLKELADSVLRQDAAA